MAFAQGKALPNNRAYLDGCSMVTAFKSKKYLEGIWTLRNRIKINCNVGAVTTNEMGSYGRMNMWYIPEGIANIFSMHELEKMYRITYNSLDGYYVVHTPRGQVVFHKDKQGLPYIDLDGSSQDAAIMLMMQNVQNVSFRKGGDEAGATAPASVVTHVQTVQENYKGHTKREVMRVKEARRAQAMMGNPSKKDFKGMVSNNMVPNCPIDCHNITNVHTIFGPDLASVQGNTVRCTTVPVVTDYVTILRGIVERNQIVTMAADVFFVDGKAFLVTLSWKIKFVTAEHMPVRTA
jgi:hypothetical protein